MSATTRENTGLPVPDLDNFDPARWIALERLRLVATNLPVTLIVTVICAGILASMLRHAVPWPVLVAWVSTGTLISYVRYRRYDQFRKLPDHAIDTSLWTQRLVYGTGLSGIFWGSSAAILFPPGDLPHQVLITFVLAGLAAGAMTSYAAISRCYILFVAPAILPMAIRLALQKTEIHASMSFLGVLFLAAVVRAAFQTERMIETVLNVRAENVKLTKVLRHQATHDPLIDIPNKREFHTRLASLVKDSLNHRQPYALLFIDLDYFKEINDTGGHAAGDETLRRIGQLIKSCLCPTDTVARMGGDEFAVLLPGRSREPAERFASALLAAIEGFTLPWKNGTIYRVSASIGVVYAQPGEYDITALLSTADAACYRAKTAGRGRIHTYRADPHREPSGRFEITKLRQQVSGSSNWRWVKAPIPSPDSKSCRVATPGAGRPPKRQ